MVWLFSLMRLDYRPSHDRGGGPCLLRLSFSSAPLTPSPPWLAGPVLTPPQDPYTYTLSPLWCRQSRSSHTLSPGPPTPSVPVFFLQSWSPAPSVPVGWCSASASNRGVGQSRFARNFPADRRKSINVHCVAVDNETISFPPEVVRCWIN